MIGAAIPVTASEAVLPANLAGAPSTMVEVEDKESPSSFPLDGQPPPNDLTRSQLDLGRVGRVKAFARAMEDMLARARKALLKETLEVGILVTTAAVVLECGLNNSVTDRRSTFYPTISPVAYLVTDPRTSFFNMLQLEGDGTPSP